MKQHLYESKHWTLDDLLVATKGSEFTALLEQLEAQVAELEACRPSLSPDLDAESFLALLVLLKSINEKRTRVEAYAALWFSADTQSPDALSFRNQVDQHLTNLQNRLLFFDLWWKALPDASADRLTRASGDDAYHLETLRRFRPHTLTEPEEKVINLKDVNGANALNTIYAMLTTDFAFHMEVDGQTIELTRAGLSVYTRDPRPDIRAGAYQELYRVYGQHGPVLAQIYNHLVQDWASENIGLRRFTTPISVRNLANDIADPVVDTLLRVCRENVGVFQRYFRWKADQLGTATLRRYDIYAPVSQADKSYPFSYAVDLVLDTFDQFSAQVSERARQVFEARHIDADVRKGKDTGAFCLAALPGMPPWVLLNYTGKAADMSTLAHELGHAVHASIAGHHSLLTFHATLPLAETASVFAEQLLTDRLLAEEPDVAVRRDLLVSALDDAYATVMRQAYFVLYEQQAHEQIRHGATVEELNALYMANLEEQFADAVNTSAEFKWEWTSIPHIYRSPFYCYAYSFGQLLVLSLYQRYKEQGASFVPHYLRILAHGGAASPDAILSEASIDMRSASFWQGGFDVILKMIDELEAL